MKFIAYFLIAAVIVGIIYGLLQFLKITGVNTSISEKKCQKCKGLGYWEGLRSRERCDACKGTGRIAR